MAKRKCIEQGIRLWLPSVLPHLPNLTIKPESTDKFPIYQEIAHSMSASVLNFILFSASDRDLLAGNLLKAESSHLIFLKFVKLQAGQPRAQAAQLDRVRSRLEEIYGKARNEVFSMVSVAAMQA